MPNPGKKTQLFPQLVQLNKDGMTVVEACAQLGVSPVTASRWFKDEGVQPVRVRTGRLPRGDAWTTAVCDGPECTTEIKFLRSAPRRFCSRDCTNRWQREVGTPPSYCLCGTEIKVADGNTYKYSGKKYCSNECRKIHGKKKQPKPENHVTFTCQNEKCSKEVTRPKGQGYHKYCSNECARKHTKTKKHIVVDDAVVLDSPWEALFWGLCSLHRVPVERFDRENGIPWRDDGWYAPDFYIPSMELAVEIKGLEDPEDSEKWASFRAQHQRRRLVVLDRESLKVLCGRVDSFTPGLGKMAYIQHGDL